LISKKDDILEKIVFMKKIEMASTVEKKKNQN